MVRWDYSNTVSTFRNGNSDLCISSWTTLKIELVGVTTIVSARHVFILEQDVSPVGFIFGSVLGVVIITIVSIFACYGCSTTHRRLSVEHDVEALTKLAVRRASQAPESPTGQHLDQAMTVSNSSRVPRITITNCESHTTNYKEEYIPYRSYASASSVTKITRRFSRWKANIRRSFRFCFWFHCITQFSHFMSKHLSKQLQSVGAGLYFYIVFVEAKLIYKFVNLKLCLVTSFLNRKIRFQQKKY